MQTQGSIVWQTLPWDYVNPDVMEQFWHRKVQSFRTFFSCLKFVELKSPFSGSWWERHDETGMIGMNWWETCDWNYQQHFILQNFHLWINFVIYLYKWWKLPFYRNNQMTFYTLCNRHSSFPEAIGKEENERACEQRDAKGTHSTQPSNQHGDGTCGPYSLTLGTSYAYFIDESVTHRVRWWRMRNNFAMITGGRDMLWVMD